MPDCIVCHTELDPAGPTDASCICVDPGCHADWVADRLAEDFAAVVEGPDRLVARGRVGFPWAVVLVTAIFVPDPPPSDP
jgi:hypothetical protein